MTSLAALYLRIGDIVEQAQAQLAGAEATKEQLRKVQRHLALLDGQLHLHVGSR